MSFRGIVSPRSTVRLASSGSAWHLGVSLLCLAVSLGGMHVSEGLMWVHAPHVRQTVLSKELVIAQKLHFHRTGEYSDSIDSRIAH